MKNIVITGQDLTIRDLLEVARENRTIVLHESAKEKVDEGAKMVAELVKTGKAYYGINTGFGILAKKQIDTAKSSQLAENIIVTHAVATGEDMPIDWVRAGMLVRINSLAKGNSGIRHVVLQTMIDMLNKGIIPAIPRKGSLASSGDLCLLSHMALTFCETQEDIPAYVYLQKGGTIDKSKCDKVLAKSILAESGITKVKLGPKEGLAITNGSSITAGIACLVTYDASRILKLGIGSLALSCEALCAKQDAFDERIHKVRNQKGQCYVAECVRKLINGSKMETFSPAVQDSYCLRCAPQVQGVLYESLKYVTKLLTNEINAVTDNPLLFQPGDIISGGNFHGEIIGHAMDTLKTTVAEFGGISERRSYKMLSSNTSNKLPDMLTPDPGLNSGYMIVQYTSVALALENLKLAQPDTIYSLPTSGSAEDYNANGTNATLSAVGVNENVMRILVNEILCAVRGIELRGKDLSNLGTWTKKAYSELRGLIGENLKDHYLKTEMEVFANHVWQDLGFTDGICKEIEADNKMKGKLAIKCLVFTEDEEANFSTASAVCAALWENQVQAKYMTATKTEAILKARRKDIAVLIQVKGKEGKIEVLDSSLPAERVEEIKKIVTMKVSC